MELTTSGHPDVKMKAAGETASERSTRLPSDRIGPRVAAYIPVKVRLRDKFTSLGARSRDIGSGGICIATPGPLSMDDIELVTIEFPGRTVSLPARGCWQRRAEDEDVVLSGIQFTHTTSVSRRVLAETVQRRALEIGFFLDECETLKGFNLDDRIDIAMFSRLRQVAGHRAIYRSRDRNRESLFAIFRGSVTLKSSKAEIEDRVLLQGEGFGGLSLISDSASHDTCITNEDTQLIEIDEFAFRCLESARPLLARRVINAVLSWTLSPGDDS